MINGGDARSVALDRPDRYHGLGNSRAAADSRCHPLTQREGSRQASWTQVLSVIHRVLRLYNGSGRDGDVTYRFAFCVFYELYRRLWWTSRTGSSEGELMHR